MSAHHSTPDKPETRYTADLININEQERDIIIEWGEFCVDQAHPEQEALLNRFRDWKIAREHLKKLAEREASERDKK